MELILASGSPRRRELLERIGLSFTVIPSQAEEILSPGLAPEEQVVSLSLQKARAVQSTLTGDAVILSADTVVVLERTILGKPKDPSDAKKMLSALSGRSHLVFTGVTVLGPKGQETHCEKTEVFFRPLSSHEIEAYVSSGDPMDKAGAYGVQGMASMFVEKLVGDYYNVMGLPVCQVGLMLRRAGIPVLGELP